MHWKDNAPYVLVLSHDVDRIKKQWYHYVYYGLKHPIVQCNTLIDKLKGHDPYWNFEAIIELEKKYGVRSTFFFLNESRKELSPNFMGRYKITSKCVSDMIRTLDRDGFEIGLHGSFFSYNDLGLLMEEKRVLEDIVGHSVVTQSNYRYVTLQFV